jgi:hypothetical protein
VSFLHTVITDFVSDSCHKDNYRRLTAALVLKENNQLLLRLQFYLISVLRCSSKGMVEWLMKNGCRAKM